MKAAQCHTTPRMTQESGILDRWRMNLQRVTMSEDGAFETGPHGPAACLLPALHHWLTGCCCGAGATP